MNIDKQKSQATLELLFAGVLWGFGFIAAKWALQSWNAVEITSLRFLLAFLIGLIFFHKRKDLLNKKLFIAAKSYLRTRASVARW